MPERIVNLIVRHLRGELMPAELKELQDWADSSDSSKALLHELMKEDLRNVALREFENSKKNIWEKIRRQTMTALLSDSAVQRLMITFAGENLQLMPEIKLQLNEQSQGTFYIYENGKQAGEMSIAIAGNHLTAYHTEVLPEMEGKGLAKKLLAAMTAHARTHHLKVIPLCPYVLAQFKRHEEEYEDIWEKVV